MLLGISKIMKARDIKETRHLKSTAIKLIYDMEDFKVKIISSNSFWRHFQIFWPTVISIVESRTKKLREIHDD